MALVKSLCNGADMKCSVLKVLLSHKQYVVCNDFFVCYSCLRPMAASNANWLLEICSASLHDITRNDTRVFVQWLLLWSELP